VAAAVAVLAFGRALGLAPSWFDGDEPQAAWEWDLAKDFPTPAVPADTPVTIERVDLGRRLFYDQRLSGNGTTSCGTCHMQSKAFTDGRARAKGSTGQIHSRSALAVINIAFNRTFAWANPSLTTPEQQMLVPLFGTNPVEMGVNDKNKDQVLGRLSTDTRYTTMFSDAFPDEDTPISWSNIVLAISAFERTLISDTSRYDQYLAGTATLNPAERRGMNLFFGERAECHHCHSGINFNNQLTYVGAPQQPLKFHNTGLYNVGGTGVFPQGNTGLHEITGLADDQGRFRVPTLRNIALTAPYMHDGTIPTLGAVVAFYAAGGRNVTSGPNAGDGRTNPHKDPLITRITLTSAEQADIVAFLRTLTDTGFVSDPAFSDPFGKVK
jgi:cytochrome c peroxidase